MIEVEALTTKRILNNNDSTTRFALYPSDSGVFVFLLVK